MDKRIEVLRYSDETQKLEVRYEGELIKTMTHQKGIDGFIKSYEVCLVKLDNGMFRVENIELIRLKRN